jgi:uncharacterized protein
MDQPTPVARVAEHERIASLDIIRGVAILFILFLNIPHVGGFTGSPTFELRAPAWGPADSWTVLIVQSFLDGTQRGLLELLFGAGILIMARKAMTPDGPVGVADLHYRRNLWLIVFGLFNAFVLFWSGDILLLYGIAAIFLFPFRRMSARGQLAFAGLLLASLLLMSVKEYRDAATERARVEQVAQRMATGAIVAEADRKKVEEQRKGDLRRSQLPSQNAESSKRITAAVEARQGGPVAYWRAARDGWLFIMGYFWWIQAEIMATMLIGMALFQRGILQGKARTQTYLLMLVAGYGIGIGLRGSEWLGRLEFRPGMHWQGQFGDLSRLAVTLGHVGLIHLLLRASAGRWLLAPFAAAGKIPLTVYLFTSFLMTWVIFAPWGFAMFGKWSAWQLATVAAIVIALELVAANLWVRRFANGPVEWLWKSLAYEQRQPFRRERPALVAAPAAAE